MEMCDICISNTMNKILVNKIKIEINHNKIY